MKDVIKMLKSINAIVSNSHFVYTSGKHGSMYVRKDLLYPHTKITSDVCKLIAQRFKNKKVDVVVSPALGGIVLSQWTAYHLSRLKGIEVLGLFTEKDEKSNQVFKRGYAQLVWGKNVLIVEDLATTGGSVKKVLNAIRKAGGKITGVCVMVNRDPKSVTSKSLGASLSSLGTLEAESFDEDKCQLCLKNVPINTIVGHGKNFLLKNKRS